jgi:hypothetical protein
MDRLLGRVVHEATPRLAEINRTSGSPIISIVSKEDPSYAPLENV